MEMPDWLVRMRLRQSMDARYRCSRQLFTLIAWCRSGEGSRAERYTDMIGLQKKKSDELTKGAKVEDLYSEAKPVSAANTKPGHKEAFKYDE